jgi:hypothetical protein
VETQQIVQSLSYVTWVLLGSLALGSLALAWLLRQLTDATAGFLGFSGILAGVLGIGWLLTEWGLPEPLDLAVGYLPELDQPRRVAIAVFIVLAFVSGTRLRAGGRALVAGAGAIVAGVAACALAAWSFGEGAPISVSYLVQLLALAAVTGGSLGAVVLAHWYLVTPRISERPLVLTTKLLMLVLAVQLAIFGAWTAAGIPGGEPFAALTGDNLVFVWLRLGVGLIAPLVLSWMAWRTALTRSMESATGLLYIEFALVMASTIVASGLLFGEGLLV